MSNFGNILKQSRKTRGLSLKEVSKMVGVDIALLSKIERGIRPGTKEQINKLANCYDLDIDGLLDLWLSEKIVHKLKDEKNALDALNLAEAEVNYRTNTERSVLYLKVLLQKVFKSDPRVQMAWIFGSYSRSEEDCSSDIDIMIRVDEFSNFSIFDLADLQHKCQLRTSKQVDLVVEGSLDSTVAETVIPNMIPIYEK